ncbi:MAG: TolC family protein [Gemmatimonadota bacterium]
MRAARHAAAAALAALGALAGPASSGHLSGQEIVPGAAADTAGREARLPAPDRSWSIDRAVSLALRNNRALQVSRLDLATAEQQVEEAYGALAPTVDASAGYQRNLKVPTAFLPAFIFDPEAPPDQLVPVRFGADNQWTAGVTVDQPLFDAAVLIGVSTSSRFRGLRREALRGTAQQVATTVRIAYLNVLVAREAYRVTSNSVQRVERTLEETSALNRAGLVSDYDVLRLEVQLSNIRPNLRRAENAVREAERLLAIEMGLPEVEQAGAEGDLARIDLEDLDANDEANRRLLGFAGVEDFGPGEFERLHAGALATRSDLQQLRLQKELEEARVKVQRSDLFPRLSAFFNYAVQAQQDGSPDFFGSGPDQRSTSSSVGLLVEVPVFSGFQRVNRIQQREIAVRQAEERLAEARQRVENEVRTTLEALLEARDRAIAQRAAVGEAERGFEIVSTEYLAGTRTRLEVTDAETALRQAELNYAEAVYDYLVARARLDLAVGVVPEVESAVASMVERPGEAPEPVRPAGVMESGR